MTHLARIPRAQERTDLPAGWSPALQQWFDDEVAKIHTVPPDQIARELEGDMRVRELYRRALLEDTEEIPRFNVAGIAVLLSVIFWGFCFGAVIFADRIFGEPTYRTEIEQ